MVRIDKVKPELLFYHLLDSKISYISVAISNKYEKSTGFAAGYGNGNLILKSKASINPKKVLSYEEFNKPLTRDFLKVAYFTDIFLVLGEDKDNYLMVYVRPLFPAELQKQ